MTEQKRKLHVYKIVEGGGVETSHVVEESPDAAVAALKLELGLGDDDDDLQPVELADDSMLTVDEDGKKVTRTCAEWCAAEGPGVLCATYF